MYILGISAYYHDSAICLLKDGHILFAAQEERYSRIKNDAVFPTLALIKCLDETSVSLSEIDAIIYYEKPFLKLERILKTYIQSAPKGLFSFIQAMHVWTKEKLFIKRNLYRHFLALDEQFDKHKTTLLFSEHHLSHAASAFFLSPFQEAAILTIDGVGEYTTTSLALGKDNKISILREIHFPHSIGLFYSSITYFLGFNVNCDEYKVMGLAAYGNPDDEETKQFIRIVEQTLLQQNADGSFQLNKKYFSFEHTLTMVDDTCWEKLFGIKKRQTDATLTQSHCNLAFAFQKATEKVVLQLCATLQQLTQAENLCLAGGVALNSVINGIIKQQKIFKNMFIQPASGDAGGALGAALAAYYLYFEQARNLIFPDAMQNSLLGNGFTASEIQAIRQLHNGNSYECSSMEEVYEKTAQYIHEGKVIGWVQGRMEFGPRALGNRSILADASNANMQKYLNLKIKNRESFRPFAPAVLEEDASLYFDFEGASPYMLEVHQVNKSQLLEVPTSYSSYSMNEKLYTVKSTIPAVTHVDFSARIQTVSKAQHPIFWNLIQAYKRLSGRGLLINTSFNSRDEPIVATPSDAYACFKKTGMDILVVGNVIFYK